MARRVRGTLFIWCWFISVCCTELGVAAIFQKQFEERRTKLMALSIDAIDSQKKWVADINAYRTRRSSFP